MTSDTLRAANERLYELRARLKDSTQYSELSTQGSQLSGLPLSKPGTDNWVPSTASLPPHLGWESAAVTAVLRKQTAETQPPTANFYPGQKQPEQPLPEVTPAPNAASGKVTIYPAIAIALLRQEQAATGRLWWLLRYLDRKGQGMLRLAEVVEQLTRRDSPLYLCSKRQLRHLLQTGGGVFWRRDADGRLWLRSAAKVAFALGVRRLAGQPVQVSVSDLLCGMGRVRAVLYAAFHQSRKRPTPIARVTLQEVTGACAQSQRTYERQTGITVTRHFAIGAVSNELVREETAWEKGQAVFEFKDTQGKHGREGGCYVAWQLPNSYQLDDPPTTGRRVQRRINRQLSDLLRQGTTGNGEPGVKRKRYYPNGASAAKAFNRLPEDSYWPGKQNGRTCLWYVLR